MTFYHETLLKLHREVYPKEQLTQQVIRAKQFIDLHFAEDIDLSIIAPEAFYSKCHFIRCFKLLYGRTPHQYLISVRIERAKQFLQTSDSLGDVCVKVGFNSTTSFIGLFKKMTGTTPAAYRKKQFSRAKSKNHC